MTNQKFDSPAYSRSPGRFVGEVRQHPVKTQLRARGYGEHESISIDELMFGSLETLTAPFRWTGEKWEPVDIDHQLLAKHERA